MSDKHHVIESASLWVKRFIPLISKDGLTLDLACGAGRHAELLALMGYRVLAVDQDVTAIEMLGNPAIASRALNLEGEEWPLVGHQFSGIVVTNYLYRPYLDELPEMLQKEGVLIYETFAEGNAEFGKPSNPNFLLNSGELLTFASRHSLKVVAYEDIYVDQPKPAMIQRLCAVKGQPKQYIPLQFQG